MKTNKQKCYWVVLHDSYGFVRIANFNWLPGNIKFKKKNIYKILLRNNKEDEAEIRHICL